MTIVKVEAVIQCDKCGTTYEFHTRTMPEVRKKARQHGWETKTGKDYCVNCAMRMEETK